MVAKKKPGKVSEAYVVKRPASPQLRPPTGSARAELIAALAWCDEALREVSRMRAA